MVAILRLDPLPVNLAETRAQAVTGSAKNVKPTQPQVEPNKKPDIGATPLRIVAASNPVLKANPAAAQPQAEPPAITTTPISQPVNLVPPPNLNVSPTVVGASNFGIPTSHNATQSQPEPVLPAGLVDILRPTKLSVNPISTSPVNPTSKTSVGVPSPLPILNAPSAALEQTAPAEDPVADSLQLSVLQSRLAAFQVASLGLQGLGFSVPNAGARIEELSKPRLEIKETKAISTYG